jgi:hypothetical protein
MPGSHSAPQPQHQQQHSPHHPLHMSHSSVSSPVLHRKPLPPSLPCMPPALTHNIRPKLSSEESRRQGSNISTNTHIPSRKGGHTLLGQHWEEQGARGREGTRAWPLGPAAISSTPGLLLVTRASRSTRVALGGCAPGPGSSAVLKQSSAGATLVMGALNPRGAAAAAAAAALRTEPS